MLIKICFLLYCKVHVMSQTMLIGTISADGWKQLSSVNLCTYIILHKCKAYANLISIETTVYHMLQSTHT